ncbi:MAG: glycosyltransferase family 4 protein [Phycisphaerales bacterium]|nr:glycosyltransferase family 4 protein [Phycisphaerales bacterium]
MRVIYLAAGAGGMICGSCIRDNRLVATLRRHGRDALLVPLYTPLRVDEDNVAEPQVRFGGINVYLQQSAALFRRLTLFDWLLDRPWLIRWASRGGGNIDPSRLGPLTLSVLRGADGRLKRELRKLIDALKPLRPNVVNIPNLMFAGFARPLSEALGAPVVCTLSGEDLFLDSLPETPRREAIEIIRERARDIAAFVSVSSYFAAHCGRLFGLPEDRLRVIPLGITPLDDTPRQEPNGVFTLGFLGRVCHAKGLHNLTEALIRLHQDGVEARVVAAGHMPTSEQRYLDDITRALRSAGAAEHFEYRGELSLVEKLNFLRSLHAFSMPTVYHEAKGLPVLEAQSLGVPVAQPRHGAFPEWIEPTGGGLLYDPAEPHGLATTLARLASDSDLRRQLGAAGHAGVRRWFTDERMARETWDLYERVLRGAPIDGDAAAPQSSSAT